MKIVEAINNKFTAWALEKPILIFPILGVYLFAWYILTLLLFKILGVLVESNNLFSRIVDNVWYHVMIPIIAVGGFVYVIAKFLRIVIIAFRKHLLITANTSLIINIIQLFIAITLTFGVIYYYIDIFNYIPGGNFHNIKPLQMDGSNDLANFIYKRYTAIPSFDNIINYMYLSLTTISNLGFGDIYPTSGLAKLFCSIEVLIGILILAVSISAALNSTTRITASNLSLEVNQNSTVDKNLPQIQQKEKMLVVVKNDLAESKSINEKLKLTIDDLKSEVKELSLTNNNFKLENSKLLNDNNKLNEEIQIIKKNES